MDMFNTFDNYEVDLDDLETYPDEWKDMNVHELFSLCMREAGRSLFYMDFLHKEIEWEEQRSRVETLCEELSIIWNNRRVFDANAYRCTLLNEAEYRLLLMKWLYRFQDEVENQC